MEIRKLRKNKKISVMEIAIKMGVHIATVYAWELGRRIPTIAEQRMLEDILRKEK